MADQNITELPVKTSSGITSSDYMLGIDSAEGYQMLIRDLGDYIIRNVQVNTIAGSNQTLKSALDTLNSKDVVTTVTDLNDATEHNKVYKYNTGASNAPSSYGFVQAWVEGNNIHQLAVSRGSSTSVGMSERARNSSNEWGSWVKIPTRTEMDALINRGENLLQFANFIDGAQTAGITFTKSGNGIIATGTGTNEGIVDIDRHLSLPAGTYYFGGCYNNTPWLQIMNDDNTVQIGDSRNANPTLTFNSTTDIYVRFHISNGATYSGLMTPFLCRIS